MKDDELISQVRRVAELWPRGGSAIAVTGAGISVASKIPDFRSPGGLWSKFNPYEVATAEALENNPRRVWEFLLAAGEVIFPAKPSPAHLALARLEEAGLLAGVVTQNIDNLHQAAGSKNVVEYHGSVYRYYCRECGLAHSAEKAKELGPQDIPWRCEACGGVVRPDIVFFGEAIPLDALEKSGLLALSAKLVLVVGTSGEVAPANYLPLRVKELGGILAEINLGPSMFERHAKARITGAAERVLPWLADILIEGDIK